MQRNSFLYPLSLLAVLSIGFYACQKDKSATELTPQEEQQVALAATEADAESDLFFNDVFDDVVGVNDEVGMQGTGIFGGRVAGSVDGRLMGMDTVPGPPPCVTVTVERLAANAIFPVRITTDFGTSGCTGRDGHKRYGKIITTYTGRLTEPGKSATTHFEGYKVDSTSVIGTHIITNTTTPGSGRQFTVEVTNGKLTRPSGNYTQWTAHRVITQVEGSGTPLLPMDDVFTTTGNSHGTVKRGNLVSNWESVITEPLRKRFACRWISKGRIRVNRTNLPGNSPWISVLDFGTGACDRDATLTVNGITIQITLP